MRKTDRDTSSDCFWRLKHGLEEAKNQVNYLKENEKPRSTFEDMHFSCLNITKWVVQLQQSVTISTESLTPTYMKIKTKSKQGKF